MAPLTGNERHMLAYIRDAISQGLPDAHKAVARTIADGLRQALPDVEDVLMARVLLHINASLAVLANGLEAEPNVWDHVRAHVLVSHLNAAFAAAAADLAALELDLPAD